MSCNGRPVQRRRRYIWGYWWAIGPIFKRRFHTHTHQSALRNPKEHLPKMWCIRLLLYTHISISVSISLYFSVLAYYSSYLLQCYRLILSMFDVCLQTPTMDTLWTIHGNPLFWVHFDPYYYVGEFELGHSKTLANTTGRYNKWPTYFVTPSKKTFLCCISPPFAVCMCEQTTVHLMCILYTTNIRTHVTHSGERRNALSRDGDSLSSVVGSHL